MRAGADAGADWPCSARSLSWSALSRGVGPNDQAMELAPPGDAELWVGAVQVRGDRARRQEQPVGDLPVGIAAGGQEDDLPLLRSQLPQSVGGPRGVGNRYPACAQLGLGTLRPRIRLEPPESLQRGDEERLGLVDPAAPAHPSGVVELQLCSLERPLLPRRV